MRSPNLEVRGTSIIGWLCVGWPFGYLQIYDDHIEVTSNYIRKENILSIKKGLFRKFLTFLPGALIFQYYDPFDKMERRIAFASSRQNQILTTLKSLGYPVDVEIKPSQPMRSFRLWRG